MRHDLPGHHAQRHCPPRNQSACPAGDLPVASACHRRRYHRDRARRDPGQPDRRRRDDRRDRDRQPGLWDSLLVGRAGHPPVRGPGRRPGRGHPRPGATRCTPASTPPLPGLPRSPGTPRRQAAGTTGPARACPGAGLVQPHSSLPRSSAAPSWSPWWRVLRASRCPLWSRASRVTAPPSAAGQSARLPRPARHRRHRPARQGPPPPARRRAVPAAPRRPALRPPPPPVAPARSAAHRIPQPPLPRRLAQAASGHRPVLDLPACRRPTAAAATPTSLPSEAGQL